MSNSAFEVISELSQSVDILNKILLGDKNTTVDVFGTIKPSIAKAVADAIPFNSTTFSSSINFTGPKVTRNGKDIAVVDDMFRDWGSSKLGTNLNNLGINFSGVHRLAANAHATTANNYPTPFGGCLVVLPCFSNSASVTQTYYPYNSNDVFMRTYTATSPAAGTWNPWVRVVHSGNISEYLPNTQAGGSFRYRRVFKSSTIFTRPDTNVIYISMIGGGGGGNGGNINSSKSGDTGDTGFNGASVWQLEVELKDTDTEFNIVIGTGGAGVAFRGGVGGTGTNTTFTSANHTIIAQGGVGGRGYGGTSGYVSSKGPRSYVIHNGEVVGVSSGNASINDYFNTSYAEIVYTADPLFNKWGRGGYGFSFNVGRSQAGNPGILIMEW